MLKIRALGLVLIGALVAAVLFFGTGHDNQARATALGTITPENSNQPCPTGTFANFVDSDAGTSYSVVCADRHWVEAAIPVAALTACPAGQILQTNGSGVTACTANAYLASLDAGVVETDILVVAGPSAWSCTPADAGTGTPYACFSTAIPASATHGLSCGLQGGTPSTNVFPPTCFLDGGFVEALSVGGQTNKVGGLVY